MPGFGIALESCVFAKEGKINFAYRAIPLLAYDDFGDSLVLRVRVIDFITIDKQNQIRILFDGSGFAQIGHDRAFVRALLQAAIQLR